MLKKIVLTVIVASFLSACASWEAPRCQGGPFGSTLCQPE